MLRRQLLKAIPAAILAPTLKMNRVTGDAATIANLQKGYYMLFVDVQAIDIEELCKTEIPVEGITMEIIPVRPRPGQSVQDAVQLLEVSGNVEQMRDMLGLKDAL